MRTLPSAVRPAALAIALLASLAAEAGAGAATEPTPAAAPTPAPSAQPDPNRYQAELLPADRERLFAFVTTFDSQGLLADPVVQAGLARLQGLPLSQLKRNLDVHGPVGYSSGLIFVQGNAPHQGGRENAFLGVSHHSGQVFVGFLTQGRIVVYADQRDYNALPDALRDWILMIFAFERTGGGMPQNVDLK